MSVKIRILHEQDSEGREYGEQAFHDGRLVSEFAGVIGRVLAVVVRHHDGSITLEREVVVSADNAENNEVAESVIKTIERKLNEAFPDPNEHQSPANLWVPE